MRRNADRLDAACIIAAIVLVHTPLHAMGSVYGRIVSWLSSAGMVSGGTGRVWLEQQSTFFANVVTPLKNAMLLLVVLYLAWPIARSVARQLREGTGAHAGRRIPVAALIGLAALSMLAMPDRLGLLGRGYARMSVGLFGAPDASGLLYRRVLLPALAHFTQLQGPFWYLVASVAVTYALLFCVVWYFVSRGHQLSPLALVSVGTSAFVIGLLQSPGYPEQLAYVLVLICLIVPMDDSTRIKAAVLAMLAHEAIALVLIPLAILQFGRDARRALGLVIAAYLLAWVASFGWHPLRALASHNIDGRPGWVWAVQQPGRLGAGLFFALKLLWIPVAVALVRGSATERTFIASMLGASAVAVLAGVDTTRMAGFGFLALLVSLEVLLRGDGMRRGWTRALFVVNIGVPSLYVGLNAGGHVFDGLYKLMLQGVLCSPVSKVF